MISNRAEKSSDPASYQALLDENYTLKEELEKLKARLQEPEELERAISEGDLDALVIYRPEGELIFTLDSADRAYRALVETMNEGTVTLSHDGTILYCNRRFAELMEMPPQAIVGASIYQFIAPENIPIFKAFLKQDMITGEINLVANGGTNLPVYLSVSSLKSEGAPDAWCLVATDLTEQKKNEEIVASERLARSIIEQAAEAIIVCDTSGRIIRFSNAILGLCGCDPAFQLFEDLIDLRFSEGADAGKSILPVSSTLKGSTILGLEATFEPDSQKFHFLLNSGHLKNDDGEIIGCVVTLTDITERRKIETALKKSESNLVEAQRIAHIGSWEWDIRTGKVDWSAELYSIYGLDPKTFVPTINSFADYIHPDDREFVNKIINQIVSDGKSVSFDFRIVSADGVIRILNVRGEITDFDENGKPCLMVGTNQDITERKKAEEALQKSEELARRRLQEIEHIYKSAPIGLCVFDEQLRWQRLNQKIAEINGVPIEAHLGKTPGEIVPDVGSQAEEAMRQIMETGERLDFEMSGTTSAQLGVLRFWEEHWIPLKDENGRIIGISVAAEEITERKRAEEALRESEAKYRQIVETAQEGIWLIDHNDRTVFVNRKVSEMLGYSIEEILEQSPRKFMSEVFRAEAENRLRDHMQGVPHLIDYRFIRKDGSDFWCILSSSPLFDDRGEYAGSLAMITDITERKKAEEALKKAHDSLEEKVKERTAELEEAYKTLLENEVRLNEAQKTAHLGNWDWNVLTDELYWSDEVYSIFGLDPLEFGRTYDAFLNYVHPDDRDYFDNAVKEALSRKSFEIEYRIISTNGEEHIVHAMGKVTFDEKRNPVRVRGTLQDITERKKAEEKIKILANAVESSNDAIVTESLEGIITSWNKGAEHIYGYLAEEVLGKDVAILEPANLKGEVRQLIEKIKQGKKVQHYETLRLKKDGTLINISITLSPVFDASGKLVAISAIVRDITESVKTQKALEKIDKLRIKEIHHRIKNNLQVISSLLDLQAEKFEDETVKKAFGESQDRVVSMSLIHEELYKGEGNDTDKLNFSAYLQKLAENLFQTYSLSSKNIRLCTYLEEKAFLDMDTAVPLGIIVNELISNSLKYAFTENQEGEIRIQLCREETNNEMHNVLFSLTVSDNGKGIPEDLEIENGDSLGLRLVGILVDQLDGEIDLKREQGTEFRITFNVAEKKDTP